jgi:hypothetical protein
MLSAEQAENTSLHTALTVLETKHVSQWKHYVGNVIVVK